jgi:RNA 2',3'-cyclic 3'-phosphodiesterase
LKLRLFFALWPDDPVRDALVAAARPLAAACAGRPVAPRNYHLTLVFLGGVEHARLEAIREAASGVAADSFELVMDSHGHWAAPRVAWLGASRPPAAAPALAGALWDGLEPLGFAREQRPFRPHLTVLRKCRACEWPGRVAQVCWPVRDFVLVKSETRPAGPEYEILARWKLCAPA